MPPQRFGEFGIAAISSVFGRCGAFQVGVIYVAAMYFYFFLPYSE